MRRSDGGEGRRLSSLAVETEAANRLSAALQALWWAEKDDWNAAHEMVMVHDDADCAWVHAYLHRAEGDLDNARYWYRTAGKRAATGALDAERAAIPLTDT